MADDATLIPALKTQHPKAWTTFYRSRHVTVWRFVRSRIACSQTADDITAQAFMEALRSINHFDSAYGSLDRWFFGIVRRTLAAHLRKHYRERQHLTFTDDPVRHETAREIREPEDEVVLVLAGMPTMEREVLIWMYQEQVSVRVIANRLNRTDKAVENLLYRARQHFKTRYQSNRHKGKTPHATEPAQASARPAARPSR